MISDPMRFVRLIAALPVHPKWPDPYVVAAFGTDLRITAKDVRDARALVEGTRR